MPIYKRTREFERKVIVGSRFFTLLAVGGSLVAAALMFCLGVYNVIEAFRDVLSEQETDRPFGTTSVIQIIEGLDRFLIAIVLLYFAYGVYSLFIHPDESEEDLALPKWLRVKQIGQLKQVVAEVIIVVLFVLFLRVALQWFGDPNISLSWTQVATFALLPVCTFLLALSLRLVQLHPKQPPGGVPFDEDPPRSSPRKLEAETDGKG